MALCSSSTSYDDILLTFSCAGWPWSPVPLSAEPGHVQICQWCVSSSTVSRANRLMEDLAFAPICNPTQCQWGQKAFSGPNGTDGYLKGGVEEGKGRDSTELIKSAKGRQVKILVDTVCGGVFTPNSELKILYRDSPTISIRQANCYPITSLPPPRKLVSQTNQ